MDAEFSQKLAAVFFAGLLTGLVVRAILNQ